LKYAIGEILLVVIGILIALQVNNWNEERADHIRETEILKDLRDDLVDTENLFNHFLNGYGEVIEHKKAIIKTIEGNLIWNDTLQDHINNFWWLIPVNINTTSYETLKDWGVSNIKNESLRRDIISIFVNRVDQCNIINESSSEIHWKASWQDDLSELYDLSDFTHVRILDYDQFLKSEDYANREKTYLGTLKLLKGQINGVLTEIIRVRKKIEIELERR
jgi:hypothetical protein